MSIGGYRTSLRLVSPHRWAAILVAVLVITPAAGAHTTKVRVSVVPRTSLADQPVHIRVAGLHPHSSAEIRLRVRDAGGKLWHASATFRANSHGAVDLDRASTRSGSYGGRWGMGLIASLTTRTPSAYRFRWQAHDAPTFRIDVRVRGKHVASRTFRRAMPGAVVEKHVSIASSGFYGSYYRRADIAERAPAILLLGGSEGGLPSGPLVTTLAARGFPTLSLAYLGAPGLPPTLANIPLEYFEKALMWLRAQPEADPTRVIVIGVSRGSEAAQLLGVHYPSLVSAVVASVPSNVALCGYPDCSVPAWTLGGQPVPYTQEFDNPYPSDKPGRCHSRRAHPWPAPPRLRSP